MAEYALLSADGVVENVIVADAEFIAQLPDMIASEDVDTGALTFDRAEDVTDVDPKPGIGWAHRDGEWVDERPQPEPTDDDDAPAAA